MTKKTIARHLIVGSTLALLLGALMVDPAFAQPKTINQPNISDLVGSKPRGSGSDIVTLISSLLNYALGFLGLAATLIIMFSGFQWMTAGGDEAVTKKARTRMIQGVVGIGIILASWGLGNFVVTQLFTQIIGN